MPLLHYPADLFSQKPRHGAGLILQGESKYKYLDRVDRPGAQERRDRANYLFRLYPGGEAKRKLWRQISAPRPNAFDEFLFEIIVHEYLLKAGVQVEAIEPTLAGTSATPDFLCNKSGLRFLVEAVTVHDAPQHRREIDKLRKELRRLSGQGWAADLRIEEFPDADCNALDVLSVRRGIRAQMHRNARLQWFTCSFELGRWRLTKTRARMPIPFRGLG
jgi:hypothetical protein